MNPSTRRILEEAYSYYETAWIIAYTILRYPVMAPITFLVFLARVIAEVGLWILNSNTNVSGVALKDVSTFGYQINLRLQQACFWPWQYAEWRNSPQKLSPLCQAQYIGFYNTVWLIVNDIILGLTLGGFLMTNSNILALQFLSLCDYFTQDGITVVIDWLMGWPPPAGLKLNSELNGFLGQLFLWILQIWKESMVPLRASLPYVIYTIGFAGHFGATISLSLLSDLVAAFTMHLYLFYVVAAKIYSWQVDAILSLLTIFRGKKMNVLRNRVDNAEFDLDQLLVGTILFTLLVFLFPTVAVYYLLFTLTRVGVVLIQGVFEVMLAFLNHFPLFAIMLRIKEPSRLPAGVKFTLLKPTKSAHGTVYLKMDNVPIGISTIFYQYIYIVDRLVTYYLTSAMTKSFFSGRAIPRVPRLQYPTLPERDFERFPNLKEVWDYFLTCF
ncbi:Gpi1-domain-containing protein [Rhizoclosmatium globosum]|uniref:Gpi1-domain-containing protein n=1 Tax=Rhizoclosmatium globosum TaxID=329046 RepID=A0A1Y2B621_9FUNG|nr:Gpi1-domain-containing protein [Rhizoclosmatium globosum]|eukprot:ORY29927.1 Gpi1-domain-containing protein [Rhizoclosmatium globosum]